MKEWDCFFTVRDGIVWLTYVVLSNGEPVSVANQKVGNEKGTDCSVPILDR